MSLFLSTLSVCVINFSTRADKFDILNLKLYGRGTAVAGQLLNSRCYGLFLLCQKDSSENFQKTSIYYKTEFIQ